MWKNRFGLRYACTGVFEKRFVFRLRAVGACLSKQDAGTDKVRTADLVKAGGKKAGGCNKAGIDDGAVEHGRIYIRWDIDDYDQPPAQQAERILRGRADYDEKRAGIFAAVGEYK